jgi:UDP-N-acetylmuramate--alanine ligase
MINKKPFFIGIGGSGMSALANILLDLEIPVFGYDKSNSETIEKLFLRGAKIYQTLESFGNLEIDYAVYSSAVKESHPVFQYFKEKQVLLVHRSELLHEIFSKKTSIAVAGSHGKTSTSTMLSQILYEASFDPTIMIGGEVPFLQGIGGRSGKSRWGVFESDESDGTFLNYRSNLKIVTNVDNDHLDFYKSEQNLFEAFAEFIYNTKSTKTFLYLGDKGVVASLALLEKKINLVGILEKDKEVVEGIDRIEYFSIEKGSLFFDRDGFLKELKLPIQGDHYLKNAFLSLLAAEETGVDLDFAISVLRSYTGVKRRLEFLGEKNLVQVYDDYGHHPTEIKSVIDSIKQMKRTNEKCCLLFQPHRYSRTRDHFKEFAESLSLADLVFLLPIYSAGEESIEGISSSLISENLKNVISLSGDLETDMITLNQLISPNDFLVTLGAGNVREWGEKFLGKI